MTIARRQEPHIFVANWFFGAFIIVIAMIFVVNNLELPVSMWKSYSVYAGAQDAIVQWWWGHNAVGFLLTAGVIGMNYYFIPKVSERPSWGGAFNSFMTLLSNKEKLKHDYIMWFFFSAIAYYCLATFEGPLLAIRWFNMIAHNTDWVIGHVHSGALGWVGMSAIAVFYYFIPRLWQLWIAGIGEGYMWLKQEPNGALSYSFVEVMNFSKPWLLMTSIAH